MGNVADRRHQPVVGLGVDGLRAGAEVGDRSLQAVVEDAARALGRRQVPARALEQVGAGVLDPGGLGAASGCPPMNRSPRSLDSPASRASLVEPTSVTTASSALASSASGTNAGEGADGRRAEDDLRPIDRLGKRGGGTVERPQLERPVRVSRIRVEARDLGVEPLPRGEPDRPADQAHAEDGEPHPRRRASTAPASRSRITAVRSQSRQASVIDWP